MSMKLVLILLTCISVDGLNGAKLMRRSKQPSASMAAEEPGIHLLRRSKNPDCSLNVAAKASCTCAWRSTIESSAPAETCKQGQFCRLTSNDPHGNEHPFCSHLPPANALKNGGIYKIKSQHPGTWFNAELSWDGGGSHPMASVEFNDPVNWKLELVSGNIYKIKSQHPGTWFNAELSWDGVSPHPRASVEFNDPCAWVFAEQDSGNYKIRSQHPGEWFNAELSWDGGGAHPMASVEFSDPVEWKLEEV